MKFYFSRFCQEFAFVASRPRILPIRTALIPRSLADRVGFRIQKSIQRILDGLSDKAVEMRPNLFFINFNRSGDCLFVFLRYIFLGLFSFLWLEFGHYNQSENRPFFKCPLSKCAQFSGRYLSTTLYSTSKATMIYGSKRRRGKNVAEMWHFRLESATLGENRQQWTKKNGNPSLSSDSRNFGKKMVGIERFELSTF